MAFLLFLKEVIIAEGSFAKDRILRSESKKISKSQQTLTMTFFFNKAL